MSKSSLLLGALLLASPLYALAHPGHAASGLAEGLGHPLGGLDHLLAMFAVGLWAAQQQGLARAAVPLTFLLGMLFGGLLGFAELPLPGLESGIAASVLALGLLVAAAARLPLLLASGLTAALGLFHGQAHSLELPAMAEPISYVVGFIATTAALHATGYALASRLPRLANPLIRLAGLGSAATGAWLLAG